MASYDFLTPFFRAAVIADPDNPEATRFPLWTFDPVKGKALASRTEVNGMGSLAFLTELVIKINLGFVPNLTATLNPPFEEGRKFIDSSLIEWTRSVLECQFGYADAPGVLSPKFQALIQQPQVSIGTDISIVFEAKGIGGEGAVKSENSRIWKDTTRGKMIKEIAQAQKPSMTVDEAGLDADANTLLNEAVPAANQGGMSDWYYMLKLAKEAGCWLLLVEEKLQLLSINKANSGKPTHVFRLFDFPRGVLGPKSQTYPILGFSTETQAVYLSKMTVGMRALGYDSEKREQVEVEVTDDKGNVVRNNPGDTAIEDTSKTNDKKTSLATYPVDAASPDAKKLVQAEYKSVISNMGIKITVETIGIPDLIPGNLIQIEGVSPTRFDFKYMVFEVTHTLGSSGFTTSFVAVANAASLGGEIGSKPQAKQANTAKPPSPSDNPLSNTDTTSVAAKVQAG